MTDNEATPSGMVLYRDDVAVVDLSDLSRAAAEAHYHYVRCMFPSLNWELRETH